MIETDSKTVKKSLEKRIEALDAQKIDLEIDITKLNIALKIKYTKKEIIAWMTQFCKGDLLDPDCQQKIIDVFVNAVYVFDDKIVIYYNIKDGKQISFVEMIESTDDFLTVQPKCSDMNQNAVPFW